jgi:molybdopterin molybdotransferase
MATIPLAAALQIIRSTPCARTAIETVPLAAVRGRHLAVDVVADSPWPTTDRSAMDGFACAAGAGLPAGTALPVVGESLAGHPFAGRLPTGQAIRIMTGAVVPAGADAVVPVELSSGFAGERVTFTKAVQAGQNIRQQGSEVSQGQVLLRAGIRVRAAEIGVLAVLGIARVPVFARPAVAVVATGDEVVPMETAPLPHQVRESNSWALCAQIEEAGGAPRRLGVAPDTEPELRAALAAGLAGADVLVTIGGVSKGTHDLVLAALAALGVRTLFHGIELKPGKPTFFGTAQRDGRTVFVFGLPGNPASAFTVFDLLVAPLLRRLVGNDGESGAPLATLTGGRAKANSRLQALPVQLRSRDGALCAELLPPSASGDPFALLAADGYALLPPDTDSAAAGKVGVVPYGTGTRLS